MTQNDNKPAAAPIDTPTDREFALSAAICVHPKGVYGDEGGSMCCPITHTRDASFAPSPADERAAFESLKGAWQSMPPFDVFCAGWRAARATSSQAHPGQPEPRAEVTAFTTTVGRLLATAPHFEECETPEPCLSALIHRYYENYFDREKGREHAELYIAALYEAARAQGVEKS